MCIPVIVSYILIDYLTHVHLQIQNIQIAHIINLSVEYR